MSGTVRETTRDTRETARDAPDDTGGAIAGDTPDPVSIDDGAARLSAALALVAASTAAMLSSTTTTFGLLAGLAGVVVLAVGLAVASARAVWYGAAGSFAAALLAGVAGGDAPVVVGATLAAVLAWDFGEQALAVGEQVGRDVPTWRGELGHAAASLAVGLAATIGVVVVYRVSTGGLTSTALIALSVAAILLTAALRH